jgi:hypothetical protein
VNISSEVEYPWRKPDWFSLETEKDSENSVNKDEIFKCVRKLKNEKASGEDEIINEYIKSTVNQFINVYEKLFNVIFDNGIMPSSWLIGMIKPIYKNKGDKFDPKNYRSITIVSIK